MTVSRACGRYHAPEQSTNQGAAVQHGETDSSHGRRAGRVFLMMMFLQESTETGGQEVAQQAAGSLSESADAARQSVSVWFEQWLPASWHEPLIVTGISALALVVLAIIAHLIVRYIVLPIIHAILRRSRFEWDDAIIEHKVLHRLAPVAPLLVINRGILAVPNLSEELTSFVQRLAMAIIVVVAVRSLGALLTAVNAVYSRYEISKGRPIKGYLQVVMILAWCSAGIVVIAAIVDQSPFYFLSGLGAMTAVLLLIFRDSILSLVAGIQLTGNDLIRVGDWIEMPAFNADGDVVDIALNVVKVQNWDRTISVIPAHKFLDYSFKNWRPMFESGGRRIKRALHLDMNSIRFLTGDEIARMHKFAPLRDYLKEKEKEIAEWNESNSPGDVGDERINRRNLTNIGTFRAYIFNYLRRHPKVHEKMTLLVRQLEPGPQGLPIEIYCFTNDTGWASYEDIQADLFDHLLAIVGEFGLRVFQEPSGEDWRAWSNARASREDEAG